MREGYSPLPCSAGPALTLAAVESLWGSATAGAAMVVGAAVLAASSLSRRADARPERRGGNPGSWWDASPRRSD